MFFKKSTKIQRTITMIYITELDLRWGERLNGGPKAQMLANN